MPGYTCKIVIEDTHPPVWRRVIVPDQITFFELHKIIQILFDWDDAHLHGFHIPSDDIVMDDEGGFDLWGNHYNDFDTNIDFFFKNYKWIRYIYDFGDDWRHKINIEKYEPDYEERSPKLVKYKGDNFMEDSGGVWNWEMNEEVSPFDREFVESQFRQMVFPKHKQKDEIKILNEQDKIDILNGFFDEISKMPENDLEDVLKNAWQDMYLEETKGNLDNRSEEWKDHIKKNGKVKLCVSSKTQKELLENLSEDQSSDYCKYLRIPKNRSKSHMERISSISDTLREHPEYILYVMNQDEYDGLKQWMDHLNKNIIDISYDEADICAKAFALGFGEYEIKDDIAEVHLASDLKEYIDVLDQKTEDEIYTKIETFDDRVGRLTQLYCVIELEELYKIYKKTYDPKQGKREFFRYVYWRGRMNDLLNTYQESDGTAYVAMHGMDIHKIIEKREIYAKDLPFNEFPEWEINELTDNIANRAEAINILFVMLQEQFRMPEQETSEILFNTISSVMSGDTLDVIIENIKTRVNKTWTPDIYAEMWNMISDLMIELELPILKARSRDEYAMEQEMSPWSIGMLSDKENFKNTKQQHLYEFPRSIQERLYNIESTGMKEDIDKLLVYKEENRICSEEFLYMLSSSCIVYGYIKEARSLIKELKNSSTAGKKIAKLLEIEIDQYDDVMDMWDF